MRRCTAICCWGDSHNGRFCGGKGSCNVFCCNCDGGCTPTGYGCPPHCDEDSPSKFAKSAKSTNSLKSMEEIFGLIDQNKDGFVNFEDVLHFANPQMGNNTDLSIEHKWFNSLDKNGDGKLTLKEFDSTL
uniref:EF-hand domain-containing protein n=1 Tax=Panagrolaimus sp. ES5 TaxID=591445 RepID=A0AC34GEI3_9BILA